MPSDDAHDRIDGINTRLNAVEEWQEAFKLQMTDVGNEVRANTRLTEEIHGRAEEMWEAFVSARNGFRMIGAIGNFVLLCIEKIGKYAKPLFYIGGIVTAFVIYFKTGQWKWPNW